MFGLISEFIRWFSVEQSEDILRAARLGAIGRRTHIEEFSDGGGEN